MSGELGRASYELDADLGPLRRNIKESRAEVSDFERVLDSLGAIADIAAEQLKQVKITPRQGAESEASASGILEGVRGISEEARTAARELDDVKLDQGQAAESRVAADEISGGLDKISRNANQAKRNLEEVRLAGGRNGSGIGPFGSGFGRVGVIGAAIGGGVLTGPAAAPALIGALAATPVLAGAAAGSLGVLALAFDGVGKAIGGDKKAFDGLTPSAQTFVQTIRSLDGWFDKLKETAAGSLFPGLTAGLKSALSPGTLTAVTAAVTLLGNALGMAGAEWGRYFGSAEFQILFGPLMQSAAHTVLDLSSAALHLFDALGVLARAAIPLTDWMMKGIDEGARLVDSWLHAKETTGALGHAMDEAQTSIRLLGGLIGSLINVVGSLGSALYPVSQIAVKDLTDGLNALGGMISRNKDAIRDIVATGLTGLVTAVKLVVAAVGLFTDALAHFIGQKAQIVTTVLAIGAALAATLGPESVAIAGAIIAIGLIKSHWDQIVKYIEISADQLTLAILEPFSHLPGKLGEWARTAKEQVESELASARDDLAAIGSRNGDAYGKAFADAVAANPAAAPPGYKTGSYGSQPSTPANPGGYTTVPDKIPNASYTQDQVYKLLLANGVPKDVATNLSIISARGEDPSGSPYALNDNAKTGDYSVGLFQENFLGQMGADRVKKYAPMFGKSPTTPVTAFVDWLGKHPAAQAQIAYDIFQSQGYGAWTTAKGLGITGGGSTGAGSLFGSDPAWTKNTGPKPTQPTGVNLLSEGVRNALQKAKDNVTSASSPSVAAMWLHAEMTDLDKARKDLAGELDASSGKKRAAIQAELRSLDGQIASVNKQITENIKAQTQAVKTAFAPQLSAAKGGITAAASTLKSTLDAQFQAVTQKYVSDVLAPQFFQGTDAHGMQLQTPAEAKYAAEQAADTLKSLQDAITTAADPAARDAAQKALDEYNDSIAATKERAQADYDYAQAVKSYQADRDEQERKLNLQLDTFTNGLADGTTKIGNLAGLVDGFGLSLSADDGIKGDFDALGSSVQALAKVMMNEAAALARLGDSTDAQRIQAAADSIAWGTDVAPGQTSVTAGLGGADGYFALNPLHMAAGGMGRVTAPTLFLAGEAGAEDFAFSGGGRGFADSVGSGGVTLIVGPVYGAIDQSVARQWAAPLKSELDRLIKI